MSILLAAIFTLAAHAGGEEASCTDDRATTAYREGFAAQQVLDTENAMAAYGLCLEIEPGCVPCQYELGWTYWSRAEWAATVKAWEHTLELDPDHRAAATWLPRAKENQGSGGALVTAGGLRVPIGTDSGDAEALVHLELVGRFQNYNPSPTHEADHYDPDIYSPKSARFLSDGSKVYVNSLEGLKTVVYDPRTLTKVKVIRHGFGPEDAALFHGQSTVFGYPYLKRSPSGDPNQFAGKPVESALSHDERYLWVPYYRRDFDYGAGSPSAVAIIDTRTDDVVRVMPTGPIPKYVAISPDDRWAAIAHWGDNTLGLIDISSGDPQQFRYTEERLVVEYVLSQEGLTGENRDSACGFCLRGTVFTPDSAVLLVARMGNGGIAGFEAATGRYLGTVEGMQPTPRHLVISPDGKWLYLTSNRSGYVSRFPLAGLVEALRAANGERVPVEGWEEAFVGGGARTLEVSPDGRYLFAAINGRAEVVTVDAAEMEVVARSRTDSYAVGLAVSPDGRQVWTTSQGKGGKGGNSVCVFAVRTRKAEGATPDAPAQKPGEGGP
jgi:DNA-binding beta-propeller fold protein YncE